MDLTAKKKKSILIGAVLVLVVAVVVTVVFMLNRNKETMIYADLGSYISPGEISFSDTHAYVADATGNKVYKVDLSTNEVVKDHELDDQVNSVLYHDGQVYILSGSLAGNLVVMDADLGKEVKSIEVGHTPVSAVVNGDKIYVANRFSNNVSVIDKNSLEKINDVDVTREPMSLTIAGNKLYVAGHLTTDAATADITAANVSIINLDSDEVSTVKLNNGTSSVKDIVTSPDGNYVYLSHLVGRYGFPTTQVDRGWIYTNAITILSTQDDAIVSTVLLDEVELGAPNPYGLAFNDDGSKLVVSLAGSHELMVIDTNIMLEKINAVKSGKGLVEEVIDIADFLPFLDGARVRVKLDGQGPRNIAVKDNKVYVSQYFSGNLAVVDLNTDFNSYMNADSVGLNLDIKYISLGEQPANSEVRAGEVLWNDATTSFQKWLSCSSCHPEARADGFSWDEIFDGYGNNKSTKSLLKAHVTPPIAITGVSSAEENIGGSFKTLLFKEMSDDNCRLIDEYLMSLSPVSSPHLNRDGTLTESAARGKDIYNEIGCATCHTGPFQTDMKMYDTATVDHENEPNNDVLFDTPTLVEVWRTGPWLFNGKADTMNEAIGIHLLDLPNKTTLSEEQLNDLTEYVLSIGLEGEEYSVEQLIFNKDNSITRNIIVPGSKITEVSFRKVSDDAKDAEATITLYDKDNKEIDSDTVKLNNMPDKSKVIIPVSINVPDDLSEGSYIKVAISKKAGDSDKLATDFYLWY